MNHIDRHVGMRLRNRRMELGKCELEIAERAGVDRETLSLFESGQKRVPATALFTFCSVLGLRPREIYDGLEAASEDRDDPSSSARTIA